MQKWLLWTEHQYRLPPVGKAFQELGGQELCAMSEEQFRQRSPLSGEVLHAHLDIWKSGGTGCGRSGASGTPAGALRPGCPGLCSESSPSAAAPQSPRPPPPPGPQPLALAVVSARLSASGDVGGNGLGHGGSGWGQWGAESRRVAVAGDLAAGR